MTALLAIASLAVDYGRVQVAKTEMHCAVDAAARAASVYLPNDTAGARTAAIAIAAAHQVDGRPLVLQAGDIVFGKWNSETGVFDTSSASPDAVRITAHRTASRGNATPLVLGQIVGYPTQDLVVTQTTQFISSGVSGIIGLNDIRADDDLFVASYNSSLTTNPSTSNYRTYGVLGSNGEIEADDGELYGTALLGPNGSVDDVDINGNTEQRSSAIPTPTTAAWSPAANPGGISQNYTISNNTTLAGGTYYFTSLKVYARLSFSGQATIYVNGNVDFDDDARITAYNSIPANLKIYVIGNRSFGDDGADNVRITADIEGPGTTFYADDDLRFMGRMVVKSIRIDDDCRLFYDEAFGTTGGGGVGTGNVKTVQ